MLWDSCWAVPAGHPGRARTGALCAESRACRSLPGQSRLPELVLKRPRATWLKFKGRVPSGADPCFSLPLTPQQAPGSPLHPSPRCRSPRLVTHSLEKSHQAPLPVLPPRFLTNAWNWEAGKPLRLRPTPAFDR